MTKLDTVQNGKGPKIRKGANLRLFWEADYWDNLKKIKEQQKTVSECVLPDESKSISNID
jgi:hypothetical protein